MLNRRRFLQTSLTAAASVAAASQLSWAEQTPTKIAHREGNMPKKPGTSCYELASQVPGLEGLEVGAQRLWDRETALSYKKESDRWGIRTVSLSGAFPRGTTLVTAGAPAEEGIRKTVQAAELVGATVVQIGGFFDTCPKMDDESSYGPCVELLKKMGPVAADAGTSIALELSLSLAEYQKLMQLVGHPAVRPYWDATGTDARPPVATLETLLEVERVLGDLPAAATTAARLLSYSATPAERARRLRESASLEAAIGNDEAARARLSSALEIDPLDAETVAGYSALLVRAGDDVLIERPTYDPLIVYQPRTWLLREGWKKSGSISCREVPSRGNS